MSRALITLRSPADRDKACRWAQGVPVGTRIVFHEPKRTLPQNDALYAALRDIARQVDWHGQKYDPSEWKDFMMHALRRARWMPCEDGGMVPIGMSTSNLSVAEMSDLLSLVYEFGARHGVVFDSEETRDAHRPGADKP